MLQIHLLSEAQLVLLATSLTTDADLPRLQVLIFKKRDVFTDPLIYRLLLTYLPTDAEVHSSLSTFLSHLEHNFQDVSELDISLDESKVNSLSPAEAEKRYRALRFDYIEQSQFESAEDALSTFLVQWTYHLESDSGALLSAIQLVDAFALKRPSLRLWYDTYLMPLNRLQNEYYPERADLMDVKAMENLRGSSGVKTLLQYAEQDREKAQIRRDLDHVVSPWIRGTGRFKRRKLDSDSPSQVSTSWDNVNDWILATSSTDFALAAKAVLDWNGPQEESGAPVVTEVSLQEQSRFRYAQTALALLLNSPATGVTSNAILRQIFDRAVFLTASDSLADADDEVLTKASRADLLYSSFLRENNLLTKPSHKAFRFLNNCLSDQGALESFKVSLPVRVIAEVTLFGSEEKQKQELGRLLDQIPWMTKADTDWASIRARLLSLSLVGLIESHDGAASEQLRFLGRVSADHLEIELVKSILAANQYSVIQKIYLGSTSPPLPVEVIKTQILTAIFNAYDNASNGNRTRGGMKRASEMLKAFQPKFSTSEDFIQADYLIKATHSLSFYQITLQHGVPFQPVNIRNHHDPLSLISKVLEQNPKAYTKIDDLIEIARNLVRGGLPVIDDPSENPKSLNGKIFDAEHRITYLAITAALADDDFDTAYSYITTRLSTSNSSEASVSFLDDTSWRAAFAAGKHRPSSSPKTLHERILSLSKRMDILALALTLAPTADPISEILGTWRRCEEEMDSLRAQAVEEERAFENQGEGILPGGFGSEDRELDAAETRRLMERRITGGHGPTYEEEAPMGLFDVARGAASALRKSAFPLTGNGHNQIQIKRSAGLPDARSSLDEARFDSDGQQRVRKRDMVSNMVTGGLVSGMSWVLGAPPSTDKDSHDEK